MQEEFTYLQNVNPVYSKSQTFTTSFLFTGLIIYAIIQLQQFTTVEKSLASNKHIDWPLQIQIGNPRLFATHVCYFKQLILAGFHVEWQNILLYYCRFVKLLISQIQIIYIHSKQINRLRYQFYFVHHCYYFCTSTSSSTSLLPPTFFLLAFLLRFSSYFPYIPMSLYS